MKKLCAVVLGLAVVGMAFADAKGDAIAQKYFDLQES